MASRWQRPGPHDVVDGAFTLAGGSFTVARDQAGYAVVVCLGASVSPSVGIELTG